MVSWVAKFYNKAAKNPTYVLPVINTDDGTTVKSADFVSEQLRKANVDITNAVVELYRRLQNLKLNTREYSAAKSTGGIGEMAKEGAEYLIVARDDYEKVNDQYTTIFRGGDDLKDSDEFATVTTESKSPLDQLIEAIAKQNLLK